MKTIADRALSFLLTWLLAATAYFLLAAGTIRLTSDGHSIASVWPADAVLLAMLLRCERQPRWLAVLSAGMVANVAANLATRDLMWSPFLYAGANMGGIAIAALLLRRWVSGALAGTPRSVGIFILVAGAAAPGVSALAGAATAWWSAQQPFGAAFLTWYLADALGLLIFTPMLLALLRGEFVACFRERDAWRRIEAIGLQLVTALVAYGVFFVAERAMLYMLFVPVTLVTFRIGRLGTKASVAIVALIGAVATMSGHGPVPRLTADPLEQAMLLQACLAALLFCSLPAAAALAAQRAALAALSEREAELSVLAATDSLTGLFNRGAFRARAERLLADAGRPAALLAIDLDRFKQVNDRFGHAAGDAALVHLARLIERHVRPGDVVGRLGGDEFMVLLPGAGADSAELVVRRLQNALRNAPLPLGDEVALPLAMSIGVAVRQGPAALETLAADADAALYRVKFAGRLAA